MTRSKYFRLAPIGIGTEQVEGLASYVNRLARLHGVSRHQLITHLQNWWQQETGLRLPRCESVRLNGYSRDVLLWLEALQAATNEYRLARCTMASLAGICAANCIGSVRHTRAWCPACFRDDVAAGDLSYDRLIWQLQPVAHCSLHKLALVDHCHNCGNIQHPNRNITAKAHICWSCMSDLSAHHDRSLYRRRPYFGEAEIRSLVFYIASTDEPGFQLNACNLFGQELARHIGRDAVNDAFREIFHCSSSHIPERPQLQALLAFSAYFSIDLPNLLTDPALAARQTSMPFQAVMPASRPRNLSEHRGERKEWFRDKLKKAVDGPGPYLSPPKFCAANNYSYSMARHNNARLLMQLGHLWRAQEKKRKSKLHRRVVRAAIRERQRVGSDTIRRITRDIAHGSNVPLHLVRSTFKQKL